MSVQIIDTPPAADEHNQEPCKAGKTFSRSVILALDECIASQHALRWTLKHFVRPSDDDLVVLAILEDEMRGINNIHEDSTSLLEKYATYTVDQFKGRRDYNLSVTGMVIRGNICEKLLRKARKVNASSIIIGCCGGQDGDESRLVNLVREYLTEQNSSIPLVLIRTPSPPPLTKSSIHLKNNDNQNIMSPPMLMKDVEDQQGQPMTLPRDYATQPEINANPEWFIISTPENTAVHPKKKQAKTPERYLRIRNFILDEWEKDKTRFLTKTSARRGLLQREGDVNAIGRVFDFLQSGGFINYGNLDRVDVSAGRKRKIINNAIGGGDDESSKLARIQSPFDVNNNCS